MWPSLRSTPLLETGTRLAFGILTYRCSRITDGISNSCEALLTTAPEIPAKTVAFSFRTKTSARLNETTASGSYPALRTSVRMLLLTNSPTRLVGIRLLRETKNAPQKRDALNFPAWVCRGVGGDGSSCHGGIACLVAPLPPFLPNQKLEERVKVNSPKGWLKRRV